MSELFDISQFLTRREQPEKTKAALSTKAGAASELLAAGRLLLVGHDVAIPVADDDGVDLIVDYKTTVQVKCSTRPTPGSKTFTFVLNPARRRDNSRTLRPRHTLRADV